MAKKTPGIHPQAAAPSFSAGDVRSSIYHILDDLSPVQVADSLTLLALGVSPITVRAAVNATFAVNLSKVQVDDPTSVLRLISTTIHTLQAAGRLKP